MTLKPKIYSFSAFFFFEGDLWVSLPLIYSIKIRTDHNTFSYILNSEKELYFIVIGVGPALMHKYQLFGCNDLGVCL